MTTPGEKPPFTVPKTLLVIGGTGFFGKSILDAFLWGILDQWNITHLKVLARHATALPNRYPAFDNPAIEYIDADIAICQTLPCADIVIHAAASTDARNYLERPAIEQENILAATLNYCRLAPHFHAESQILYASSGAVYGSLINTIPVEESAPLRSIAEMSVAKRPYAAAKRDAEAAIMALGRKGIRVSIARCFAFVGRWLPRDQHFAIGNFVQSALDRAPVIVKATQPVYRSYMYADDLVDWLMHIVAVASPNCPIYNVGSNHAMTVAEIARRVASQFDVPLYLSEQTTTTIDWYVPSVEKASLELGLGFKYDFDQAITATLEKLRA